MYSEKNKSRGTAAEAVVMLPPINDKIKPSPTIIRKLVATAVFIFPPGSVIHNKKPPVFGCG
jgi:hypothetical protein